MTSGRKVMRLAILGLLFVLLVANGVQAQDTGVLEGQVVNGTAGRPEIGAGLPITLRVVQGDSEVETREATTDAAGGFRFDQLSTDPSLEYWVEGVYQGVTFSSQAPSTFEEGQTALSATLLVYETTDDESLVQVDSVHIVAESFGQVLRISQIQLFGNTGDRAYVGAPGGDNPGTTVWVPLPPDAVGLSFGETTPADRFVEVEGGVRDTEAVPPGQETSLAFLSYHLVVAGDTVPVELNFDYPVATLNVLVALPGLELRSDQLQSMGTESFAGQEYGYYALRDLPAGTPLRLEFLPQADAAASAAAGTGAASPAMLASTTDAVVAASQGNQPLLRWFGFGLAGLAVVGALVYAASARRPAPARVAARDLAADPKSRRLLADLVALEEAREQGRIDGDSYEQQRKQIYEALKSS